ncbi:PLP-dependent transferase [Candidatus Pantoea persica]|uniref:PLP-dependent transferase n=1 Tax=Candidatus Pantoea persica TaxID=2518128 RepID=UPI00215DB6B0|nr:PLP-dependent transferase [Candidatus Pantoea persica]MBA2815684.1 multicopper oxidase [Candidatus Pantoea persica]
MILPSQPLYGGTKTLLSKTLHNLNITPVGFSDGTDEEKVRAAAQKALSLGHVALILIETPANPTNSLVDIALIARVADEIGQQQGSRPIVACDNTLLGPLFQRPLNFGAEYLALLADQICWRLLRSDRRRGDGSKALITHIRTLRSAIGTQLDSHSSWMIGRLLETLSLRMEKAWQNTEAVAAFLRGHEKGATLQWLPYLDENSAEGRTFRQQCSGASSIFSFDIVGGQPAAFRFLNALGVFKQAVSLGGTESLASHPGSTTHSGVPEAVRQRIGISDATIRLSIGIDNAGDLVEDIRLALEKA